MRIRKKRRKLQAESRKTFLFFALPQVLSCGKFLLERFSSRKISMSKKKRFVCRFVNYRELCNDFSLFIGKNFHFFLFSTCVFAESSVSIEIVFSIFESFFLIFFDFLKRDLNLKFSKCNFLLSFVGFAVVWID